MYNEIPGRMSCKKTSESGEANSVNRKKIVINFLLILDTG